MNEFNDLSNDIKSYIDKKYQKVTLLSAKDLIKEAKLRKQKKLSFSNIPTRFRAIAATCAVTMLIGILSLTLNNSGFMKPNIDEDIALVQSNLSGHNNDNINNTVTPESKNPSDQNALGFEQTSNTSMNIISNLNPGDKSAVSKPSTNNTENSENVSSNSDNRYFYFARRFRGEIPNAPNPDNSCVNTSSDDKLGTDGGYNPNSLMAAEWDDNLNWNFYVNMLNKLKFKQYNNRWQMITTCRITVKILSRGGFAAGADVRLLDSAGNILWSAISDVEGKAYMFYNFGGNKQNPDSVVVNYRGKVNTIKLQPSDRDVTVDFSIKNLNYRAIDLMFAFDTNRNTERELSYLQKELPSVISEVYRKYGPMHFNTSYNFFRGEGNNFMIDSMPFVDFSNIKYAHNTLLKQSCSQNKVSTTPIDMVLEDALNNHKWSDTPTKKLLFLVIGTSPTYSAESVQKMQTLTKQAAAMGVRIIPVAAEGVDTQTEYLMRSIAVATGGTYVFLSEDSGTSGTHTNPNFGIYETDELSNLLIRLIESHIRYAF